MTRTPHRFGEAFVLAMAFGVTSLTPSSAVVVAATGSATCQVSATGKFQITGSNPALCQEFQDTYVSGGPCQLIFANGKIVIDQRSKCVFGAAPTAVPTDEPTAVPTDEPTAVPTAVPTDEPTAVPTNEPTTMPTATAPGQPAATAAPAKTATIPPVKTATSSAVAALPNTGVGASATASQDTPYATILGVLAVVLIAAGGSFAVRRHKN